MSRKFDTEVKGFRVSGSGRTGSMAMALISGLSTVGKCQSNITKSAEQRMRHAR